MRRSYSGVESEFDSFFKIAQPYVKIRNWTLENVFKIMQEKCFCNLDT